MTRRSHRRKRDRFELFSEALFAFGKELLCPICLSLLSYSARLPCNHYFCKQCIEQCISDDERCPVCKSPATKESIMICAQIDDLVSQYRILSSPGDDQIAFSQPFTPTKIRQIMNGEQIVSSDSPVQLMKKKMESEILGRRHYSSFVFLLTGLDSHQRRLMTHVCTNSSVRTVSEYCDEVTHCITSATKNADGVYLANRTIKYLISILHHIPIVSFDWIEDIGSVLESSLYEDEQFHHQTAFTIDLSTTEFPSWKPYQIRGDLQVQQLLLDGPARSLNSCELLFRNMTFHLYGVFESPLPSKSTITELIVCGGGQVMEQPENTVVLVGVLDSLEYPSFAAATHIVTLSWFLDSISNYSLQPFALYKK